MLDPGPQCRGRHFVCACAVETHMDISQEPFRAAIYKKNAGPPFPAGHFARACAIEMHIDMSQELFCVEIYGEMPDPPAATSMKHGAFTVTVRALQCGHTVWGMEALMVLSS